MNRDLKAVLHDATALFRFVDAVSGSCRVSGEYPSYFESSQYFFRYITAISQSTKAFLEKFVSSLNPGDPVTFNADRQKLATLRFAWCELHEYVRPAVDAHSLTVPYSLLQSLTKRFRSVTGLSHKDFVILHTDNVNYFEAHEAIKRRAQDLRDVIPNAATFSDRFGIIEFPYSQAQSVFLNALIAHEMGHFAFQELNARLYNMIGRSIKTNLRLALGAQRYKDLSDDQLQWCGDVLLTWAEEVFCDSFAIWLVGPSFTLAYIELMDLPRRLYPSSTQSEEDAQIPVFTRSHPAKLFRVREHVRLLKVLKWWPEVEKYRTHYVKLLRSAINTSEMTFRFSVDDKENEGVSQPVLEAFFRISREVQAVVGQLMAKVDTGVEGFQRYHRRIEEYLLNGIVPSTIVTQRRPGRTTKVDNPHFIAILNSAHKFYLESLPALIERIEKGKPNSCTDRNKWLRRLEAWTMKAVEDSELLAGREII